MKRELELISIKTKKRTKTKTGKALKKFFKIVLIERFSKLYNLK